MKLEPRRAFIRDMRRIRNTDMRRRVERKLAELQNAENITEVSQVSRVKSEARRRYRVRVGDYRIGVTLEGDMAILDRILPRDDIYRRFP